MVTLDAARVGRPAAAGPALLALSLCAAIAAFWPGLASLVDAWATPEYSHGPIIPLISLFLFLREAREVPPAAAPVRDRWPGAIVAALGLAVGALGALVAIPDIVTYGLIVWIAGVVLVCFGFRRGVLFWPAILHLAFMLPLPQFIYWHVSIQLQMVSSQIGVWLVALFDIPVFLDGNIIDLGVYKLQVAEACSGLRYLFPMLSFSYVFALLYRGPYWHKALILASAAPITVLMNSFRIGMIGVLVDSYGIGHAEGFLHAFEGWIIFLACIAILMLMATLLQRLTPRPLPLSEALDVEFEGLGAQLARVRGVAATPALIAMCAITLTAAATAAAWPAREAITPARDRLVAFPLEMDGWSAVRGLLDDGIEQVLAADDYIVAEYRRPDAAPVSLFAAWYARQTEGSGIHSPEICIPAGGWEVSAWRTRTVVLESGLRIDVNRAVIQRGISRQLVYFWFEQRGRRLTGDYAVKFHAVADALRRGRSDGGIVRLITPIGPLEDERAADARIGRFMESMVPRLERFFPG